MLNHLTYTFAFIFLGSIAMSSYSQSGNHADADVIKVMAKETSPDTWTFQVTVEHPDTGWDDYCNGWNVLLEDGTVLKASPSDLFTRELLHPHENEQPFTRSQGELHVPKNTRRLRVQAHDMVHGFGGKELEFELVETRSASIIVKRQ